jgi:hypothetical protein
MGTVPVPYTWQHKEIPNFRDMNNRVRTPVSLLLNPPMIRLRKTSTQNFTTSVETAISWNFVEYESENMWDAAQPTRVIPSTPGWYIGTYGVSFSGSAAGVRQFDIRKNGSATARTMRLKSRPWADGASMVSRGNKFMEQFNGTTDYIEVLGYQNTGGTLTVSVGSIETQPDIVLRWFAPL